MPIRPPAAERLARRLHPDESELYIKLVASNIIEAVASDEAAQITEKNAREWSVPKFTVIKRTI